MTKDEEIAVCKGKVRYETKRDAKATLNHILKSKREKKHPVRIYHCDICNGHHLTSSTGNNSRKVSPLLHPEKFEELINK